MFKGLAEWKSWVYKIQQCVCTYLCFALVFSTFCSYIFLVSLPSFMPNSLFRFYQVFNLLLFFNLVSIHKWFELVINITHISLTFLGSRKAFENYVFAEWNSGMSFCCFKYECKGWEGQHQRHCLNLPLNCTISCF